MRADPNNGYVNDYQVYTGKEGNVAEKGLGERVVRDLAIYITKFILSLDYDSLYQTSTLKIL